MDHKQIVAVVDGLTILLTLLSAGLWARSARIKVPEMRITADGGTGDTLPALRTAARWNQHAAYATAAAAIGAALSKVLTWWWGL